MKRKNNIEYRRSSRLTAKLLRRVIRLLEEERFSSNYLSTERLKRETKKRAGPPRLERGAEAYFVEPQKSDEGMNR